MTSVWVVLPTYEEAGEPPDRRRPRASRARELRAARRRHVLVVDDASPDGTGELADELARAHDDVRVHHRAGQGRPRRRLPRRVRRALADGADQVIEMDADLSHDPADLPRLIEAARHGADVVLGSRYVDGGGIEGWSLHRRLLSRAGGRYAAAVLGLPFSDLTGGFKCFRAGALRALDLDLVRSPATRSRSSDVPRCAGRPEIAEIPIVFRERRPGARRCRPQSPPRRCGGPALR